MSNKNLHLAKKNCRDEFYTRYETVEKEVCHYWSQLEGKVVYCNCDNPYKSNFVKYFMDNYHAIGLKGLMASCYASEENGNEPLAFEYDGVTKLYRKLRGNGSFDSEECLEMLNRCDVVITNPPFSIFRHYFDVLIESEKEFLVLGNLNCCTYKNIFRYFKDGSVGFGYNRHSENFILGKSYPLTTNNFKYDEKGNRLITLSNTRWITTLEVRYPEPLKLTAKYKPENYQKFDSYHAINVNRIKDIPCDYFGYMGVPITIFDKFNPSQFDIVGVSKEYDRPPCYKGGNHKRSSYINGKEIYKRIFIKRVDGVTSYE